MQNNELNLNFDAYRSRYIEVVKQLGEGGPHSCLLVPGLIAIAGQDAPEIDKRICDPSGK